MKAAPPVQVTVGRFGAWRLAVGLVMAITVAAVSRWWVTLHADASLAGVWARVAFAGAAGLAIAGAASLLRQPARSLRWDGQRWHLGLAGQVGHEPAAGRLRVTLDLGGWMMLRFEPENSRRACWIPVQRPGLESSWHALRCAVYSPRPVTGEPSATAASPRLSLPE